MTSFDRPSPVDLPAATTCRSCQAPIRWVTTDRRRMPVNAAPDLERGNVVILSGGSALVLGHAEAERRRPEGLYLSHFATCTEARQWRKK